MRGRLFFFYGTLTHAHDNPAALAAKRWLAPVGQAAARGTLRIVTNRDGWYPVYAREGRGWVRGWLYRAGQGFDRRALARLDRYEEADRRDPEYRRRRIAVRIGGRAVVAEAYVHARPLHAGMKRAACADFARFLASCGARAYGSPVRTAAG